MKRVFAIVLLALQVFNLAGYSLFFGHLVRNSDTKLAKQLDANEYNDAALLEMKFPLHLPYISDRGGYERVDGVIESGGIQYSYVKRKVQGDTLYILCIPNEKRTQLLRAEHNYAKEVNGFPRERKSNEPSVRKAALVYDYTIPRLSYTILLLLPSPLKQGNGLTAPLIHVTVDAPSQPPEQAC